MRQRQAAEWFGLPRPNVGEAAPDDDNTATSALAQAFKRACVKFGLGAYLYRLPRQWVEYDAQRKRFTEAALVRLQRLAEENSAPSGLTEAQPAPPDVGTGSNSNRAQVSGNGKVGPTEFWTTVRELGIDKTVAQNVASGAGSCRLRWQKLSSGWLPLAIRPDGPLA